MIEGIILEGLIYGIMTLGVFITFRVLDFADMTVDGSFPLGAAIMAALTIKGINPALALLAAFSGGAAAGLVTAAIHARLRVPGLLAGILTMTMLYSINLRVLSNKAYISLTKSYTLFDAVRQLAVSRDLDGNAAIILFLLIVVCCVKTLVDVFFHTDFGLTMGALGSNPQMIVCQGMNPQIIKSVGVCLANGLAAGAGAFSALYLGFADVNSGTGIVVSGLASLMIGEFLIRSNKISMQTLRVFLGSIVYRALMYLARIYGWKIRMTANDFKLITGVLIIICLMISSKNTIFKQIGARTAKLFKRDDHDQA